MASQIAFIAWILQLQSFTPPFAEAPTSALARDSRTRVKAQRSTTLELDLLRGFIGPDGRLTAVAQLVSSSVADARRLDGRGDVRRPPWAGPVGPGVCDGRSGRLPPVPFSFAARAAALTSRHAGHVT